MDQDSTKTTAGGADKRNWRDRLGVSGGLPKLSEEFQAQANAQRPEPRLEPSQASRASAAVRPGAPVARPAPMAPRVTPATPQQHSTQPNSGKSVPVEGQRFATAAYPLQRATVQRPQGKQVNPPSQGSHGSGSGGKDGFSERLKAQREAAERLAQQRLAAARERAGQGTVQPAARTAAQPAAPSANAGAKPQGLSEGGPRFTFADDEIAAAQQELPREVTKKAADAPRQAARAPLPHASLTAQPRTGAGGNRNAGQAAPQARRHSPSYPPSRHEGLVAYGPDSRPSVTPVRDPVAAVENDSEHRNRRRDEGEGRSPGGEGKRSRVARARAYEDDDDFAGVFDEQPSRAPLQDRSGAQAYTVDYGEDEYEDEEPRRRNGPIVLLLSLLVLAAVAGGVLYWYQKSERGAPETADLPVITAPQQPVKAAPDPELQPEAAVQQVGRKQIYDRILGEETLEPERIVPTEEEPQTDRLGQQDTQFPQLPEAVQPPQAETAPAAGQSPAVEPSEARDGDATEPLPLPLPPPPGTGQQGDLLPPKSDDTQQTAAVSPAAAAQQVVPEPAASTPGQDEQPLSPGADTGPTAADPAPAANSAPPGDTPPGEDTPLADDATETAALDGPAVTGASDIGALIKRETGDEAAGGEGADPGPAPRTGSTMQQDAPPLPKPKPARKVAAKPASQPAAKNMASRPATKKPAPQSAAKKPDSSSQVARSGPVQITPAQLAKPAAGQTQPAATPEVTPAPSPPAPDPTAPLRSKGPLPGGRGAYIESPSSQPPLQQAAFVSPEQSQQASGQDAYVVQLASFRSEDEALKEYKRLTQRHSSLVSGLGPRVQEASLGQNVTFYRLGIGPLTSKDAANQLCNNLIAAGEKDCLVRRR